MLMSTKNGPNAKPSGVAIIQINIPSGTPSHLDHFLEDNVQNQMGPNISQTIGKKKKTSKEITMKVFFPRLSISETLVLT